MVSRKLAQRTNAWLIGVDFFYTYSWVNGLCFGYFQIFPKRSLFNQKLRKPLFPMYPDFLTVPSCDFSSTFWMAQLIASLPVRLDSSGSIPSPGALCNFSSE